MDAHGGRRESDGEREWQIVPSDGATAAHRTCRRRCCPFPETFAEHLAPAAWSVHTRCISGCSGATKARAQAEWISSHPSRGTLEARIADGLIHLLLMLRTEYGVRPNEPGRAYRSLGR